MIETMPLEKAAYAYARMMSGEARFRMVIPEGRSVVDPVVLLIRLKSLASNRRQGRKEYNDGKEWHRYLRNSASGL
jgi:hypothetical protein